MRRKSWKKVVAMMLCICILPWSYYANAFAVSTQGSTSGLEGSSLGNFETDEEMGEEASDTKSISDNSASKDVTEEPEEKQETNQEGSDNTTNQEEAGQSGISEEKSISPEELQSLVASNYVLESDLVIDGDLVLTTGNLDLNSYTLTVHGNVIQGDVVITMNGGQMFVDKDYRMQTRELAAANDNEAATYNYSSCKAVLNMTQPSDYLLVKGNIYIQTETSHSGKLTAGVMEVKGNFTQINATTTRNFCASGSHQVILSGEAQQTIEFESNKLSGSKFMNLEITNQSEEGILFVNRPYVAGTVKDEAVKCEGEISIGSQTSFENGSFGGSVYTIGSIAVSEPLQIGGSMTVNHAMTIYDSMEVKGDFTCTDEYVEFVQATLSVGGNFEVCDSEENYGIQMSHEKDLLAVQGDFKYSGYHTLDISAGTIQVKGNVNIESGFRATEKHRFVLNGDGIQSIVMSMHNTFACLEFQNDSEEGIYIYSALYYNELTENDTKITYADNMLIEDKVVNGDFELTEEELQVNGKTLIINGDYVQKQGELKVQGGNIIVTGDLRLSGGSINLQAGTLSVSGNMIQSDSGTLVMQEEQDHVTVYEDYELTAEVDSSELLTNGVLEIKGNFTQSNAEASLNYKPTGNHTLLLSGTDKQVITLEEIDNIENGVHTYINHLIIKNDSEEGVEFVNAPIVLGQIDAPEGKIQGSIKLIDDSQGTFVGDTYAGSIIWSKSTVTAEADKLQILGDFTISEDWITLESNLYVGGNISITNGDIALNGYRLESARNLNIKTETGCGSSGLTLYGENSYVLVGGDFVCDVYYSDAWYYQSGTMEVKGDIKLVKNFKSNRELRLLLSGSSKQEIEMNSTSYIPILELRNTSTDGVFSATYFEPGELILNDSRFIYGEGNENAIMGYTLTEDTVISGDLYLMLGTLDLNGHSLTVEGDFIQAFGDVKVNGGKLYVYGDYHSKFRKGSSESDYTSSDGKGKLIMQNPDDYVLVNGDLVWGTTENHEELLTDGVLELKGDLRLFVQNSIKTSGNHTLKLSGKKTEDGELYNQKIGYYSGTYFHKLLLTKPLEKGYTFAKTPEDICDELVFEYEDLTPPESVTTLDLAEVGMDYVTIQYDGATDDSKIISYCIYRDGVKIAEVSEKEYTDKNLIPNTDYVYEVYAVDEFRNQAEESPALNVKTVIDEEKPEKVSGLYVKSLSGTSVTIGWDKSADNVVVAGYNIYRDGELLADNGNNISYKDLSAEDGKEHSYEITAYDVSGNESDKSETIKMATQTLCINSLLPEEYLEIGKQKIILKGILQDGVAVRTSRYYFEYREAGTEDWTLIQTGNSFAIQTEVDEESNSNEIAWASCTWDSSNISSKSVEVRFIVEDEDKNQVSITNEYFFDETPPQKVKNVEGQCVNGVVNLTWDESKSEDCAGYVIYRSKSETFDAEEAERVDVGNVTNYYENRLEEGATYTYCIEAVDKHGLKSELSETITILVTQDKEKPIVHRGNVNSLNNNGNFSVNLSVTDNQVVSRVTVYARETGAVVWKAVKEDKNIFLSETYFSKYHSISITEEQFEEGNYEISVVAEDANGNLSDRFVVCEIEVDKTCPEKIQNVQVKKIGTTYVQLTWDELADDISYYQVEMVENGIIKDKCFCKTNFITFEGLTKDTNYTFQVIAYDKADNRGSESELIQVHTKADDVAPQIKLTGPGIKSYGSQMKLLLKAIDNQELGKAVFSYSLDKENYIPIVEVDCTGGVFDSQENVYKNTYEYEWDVSSLPEGEIVIKYEVYDKDGNHNEIEEGADITSTYVLDHTAPNKVENLKALDNGGSIALSWSAAEEGYTYSVYRADANSKNFYLLKTTDAKTFVDRGLIENKAYMYKVIAIDEAGNASEESDYVIASATKDHVGPVVESSTIKADSLLKANPTLKFVITDNNYLKHVKVECLQADAAVKSYTTIVEKDIEDCFCLLEETWDTTGLKSGAYKIRLTVTDCEGNQNDSSIYDCMLDTEIPQSPTLTASRQDGAICLAYSLNEEKDFSHYEVVRRTIDSESEEVIAEEIFEDLSKYKDSFIDDTVEMKTSYEYVVRAYDDAGNYAESSPVWITTSDEDFESPVAVLCDYTVKQGLEVQFIGEYSNDNTGVAKYEWDMGDGTILYGMNPKHTYNCAGEYSITLTVADYAGNKHSETKSVSVLDEESGLCVVSVFGEEGGIVANAQLCVDGMENKVYSTGPDGTVNFYAREGVYNCAIFAEGYQIEEFTIQVTENEVEYSAFTLRKGSFFIGEITAKEMSLEEMKEKGVDFSDPDNCHNTSFTLDMIFQENPRDTAYQKIDIGVGSLSSGGSGGNKDNNGNNNKPSSDQEEEVSHSKNISCENTKNGPTFMYISSERADISWLKNMYQVDIAVMTSLSGQCELKPVTAQLELPEGLSLAETKQGQTLKKTWDSMAGEDSKNASWIIKGDENGEYTIGAEIKGTLMPFGDTIKKNISCKQKINNDTGKGLHLYIYPENKLYKGDTYYVQYVLKNESKKTLYYVTTNFGKYRAPYKKEEIAVYLNGEYQQTIEKTGGLAYNVYNIAEAGKIPILSSGDSLTVEEFEPGEMICGTFAKPFGMEGVDYDEYYSLINAWVDEIKDDNNDLEITVTPTSSHLKRVKLRVDTRIRVYSTRTKVQVTEYERLCQVIVGNFSIVFSSTTFNPFFDTPNKPYRASFNPILAKGPLKFFS